MSNWQQIPLGDLISTMKNGSNASQNKSNNGLPITRIETISDEFINWKKVGYIKKISKSEFEKHKIRKGDILFSHINSKPHIGKTAIYSDVTNDLIHGINLLLIRANDRVNPNFLLYALRDKKISGYFASISSQSVNQASINQSQMKKVNFLIPSIDLQKQIAQILSTLQNKVELVDKQIKLYEELKKSTMEKLFSEGLHGEKQKETEIGLIPESWKVCRAGEIGDIKSSTINFIDIQNYKNGDFVINAIKVSDMNLIGNEKYIKNSIVHFTGTQKIISKLVPPKSIIFPKRGAAIKTNKKRITKNYSILDPNVIALVINKKDIDPEYIYYWFLTFDLGTLQADGVTPQLNKKDLVPLEIPLPKPEEMRKITFILKEIDEKLNKLLSKKKSYQQLFNSMLHKLMNQEIEVTEW